MVRNAAHCLLITLLLVAMLSGNLSAQMPEVWNNIYDSDVNELILGADQTDRGNFILAGYQLDRQGWSSVMLLKILDHDGEELVTSTIGIDSSEVCYDVIESQEGTYILAGRTASRNGNAIVLCTDQDGNIIWYNTYGGANDDRADCLVENPDGNFVFAGSFSTLNDHGNDYWLVKSNRDGEVIWSQMYSVGDNAFNEECYSLIPTDDDGFLLTGIAMLDQTVGYVVKVNSEGEAVWQRTFDGGGNSTRLYDALSTEDGGYLLFGETASEGDIAEWLVKVNGDGEIVWQQIYEDQSDLPGDGYSIVSADQNGIFLAAHRVVEDTTRTILRRADNEGNELWSMDFGGNGEVVSNIVTIEDGLLLTGYCPDEVAHTWVVRLGPEQVVWGVPPAPEGNEDNGIFVGNEELDAHTFHHGRDPDAFRYELLEHGENIVGQITEDGLLFWPEAEFNGIDSLLVAVLDQDNTGDTAWVTCEFTAVNDPPSAPVLLLPEEGEYRTDDTLTFCWSPSRQNPWESDSVTYRFHLGYNFEQFQLWDRTDTTLRIPIMTILNIFNLNNIDTAITFEWYIRATDGEFFVGSANHKTFTVLPLTVENNPDELPISMSISAVSPNPFNNHTSVSFSIPISSQINLAIYNLTGKLVEALANGRYPAGVHSVTWDASAQSAGVYFLKLSDSHSVAKIERLVLLK